MPLEAPSAETIWVDVEGDLGPGEAFLEIDDLRVERGPRQGAFVLEVERLCIPAGSFTAILGGSGMGKTTLLTVLGLLRGPHEEPSLRMRCKRFVLGRPSRRQVVVYEDLEESGSRTQLSARERERLRREWIGFCLQGGELVPSLTLLDNCAVPAHLCRLEAPEERAGAFLRDLGLVDLDIGNQIGKLPGELSGGQRQRGVVARALAHSPRMVLLDEPTASLDRGTAEEAIELLRDLARRKHQTVVMVTHDRTLAEDYADHILEFDLVAKRHSRLMRQRSRSGDASAVGVVPAEAEVDRQTGPADDSAPAKAGAPPEAGRVDPAAASARPSWRYHVRLGLLDALGPLARALGPKRGAELEGGGGLRHVQFLAQLLQNSAVVVAIAMLVLFLRGMRSGMIEDFRDALRTSPTARKITLHGAFSAEDLGRIEAAHPRIEFVAPVATPLVGLSAVGAKAAPEDSDPLSKVTLNGIVRGDPANRLLDPDHDFSALQPQHVVLGASTAEALGVGPGDEVLAWAERHLDARGEEREVRPATLEVFHVLPGQESKLGTAWVHFGFTRLIREYQAGLPVKNDWIDWPGATKRLVPRFASFLLFLRSDAEGLAALSPTAQDILRERSFRVAPLEPASRTRMLGGWLRSAESLAALDAERRAAGRPALKPLVVLQLTSQRGVPLRPSELDVEDALPGDLLVVPWNPPLAARLPDGRALHLVGLGFERSNHWLRHYMVPMPRIFLWDETDWRLIAHLPDVADEPLALAVGEGEGAPRLAFEHVRWPQAPAAAGEQGFVAAHVLGRLHALAAGEASVDVEAHVISRATARLEFGQVSVYPDDVFLVPEIVAALKSAGYPAYADAKRLREIEGYTEVLGYIVRVTSILAGIIALITVALVFHDVGRSKKRVLATLRIMGLTRGGAFTILMVRGVLVALLAGLLLVVLGTVGSALINGVAGRSLCLLGFTDYVLVLAGVLAVCVAGTYLPARNVSRIEPVVALQEAEQQG